MTRSRLKTSPFWAIAVVAALGMGLTACGSSDDDTAEAPVVEPTPEPTPPPGPTDLEQTQADAAAAAAAAMTASTSAATAASNAADATANIATLQTKGKAADYAAGARNAADEAMAEYMKAKAGSDAAAAATTGAAAEEAWSMAVAARDAARAAAGSADEMAMKAIEAAMTELHIDDTVKNVGDSSVDAKTGTLIEGKKVTGLQRATDAKQAVHENFGASVPAAGRAFGEGGVGNPDISRIQAVAARNIKIGKTLDTTDDSARLVLVTGYASTEKQRVFVDQSAVRANHRVDAEGRFDRDGDASTDDFVALSPVGAFTEATDTGTDGLTHDDVVGNGESGQTGKSHTVLSYVNASDITQYVVEVDRVVNPAGVTQTISFQPVDIMAAAAVPDSADDTDADADDARVTADVPVLAEYEHIHFGVWASLSGKPDAQSIANLGMGFVQTIMDSEVTEKQGLGMATFNGNWVSVVRQQYLPGTAETNVIDDGVAELTANFGDDSFKGVLDGLATLSGSLSGNGFTGTKATGIDNPRLDAHGSFEGSFSGSLYGEDGAEAAGVFSFDGGEAGAFRGAFGGRDKNNK